jgi:hypothetical protein
MQPHVKECSQATQQTIYASRARLNLNPSPIKTFGKPAFFFKGFGLCCKLAVEKKASEIQKRKSTVCGKAVGTQGLTRTLTDINGQ